MKKKIEEQGVLLVQREGRVSIPRDKRDNIGVKIGDFVFARFRKATDAEILAEAKRR